MTFEKPVSSQASTVLQRLTSLYEDILKTQTQIKISFPSTQDINSSHNVSCLHSFCLHTVSGWTERSHVQDAWDSWVFSRTLQHEVKYSKILYNVIKRPLFVIRKCSFVLITLMSLFFCSRTHCCTFTWCAPPSLSQLSNMSEDEDVLLEFFVSLPQLKQVTSDKEELVTNIVDMASKFPLLPLVLMVNH